MKDLAARSARAARAAFAKWQKDRLVSRFDAHYAKLAPLAQNADAPAVLVDGLWDNPNHFFRLRIFLEAMADADRGTVVAVLRTPRDRTRHTLVAFGIRHFEYLEKTRSAPFDKQAAELLAACKTHRDVLAVSLPGGMPAYVFYDTVLKLARDPQPPLSSPIWRRVLASHLRDLAFAERVVQRRNISQIVLSHPWKSEYAALLWSGLERGARVHHLTAYSEGIRIRRFRTQDDYRTPVEHLSWAQFSALAPATRESLVAVGAKYLDERARGLQTDINARMAYRPDLRIAERQAARIELAGRDDRPAVLVSAHVWYDFPHTFAMRNFTDFKDWMEATIAVARRTPEIVWLLKPHPTEAWYGKFALASIAKDLPAHIRLLPVAADTATALLACDSVVTVHGTIAVEAAARGLPVLAADRSYFSDWNLATEAWSRVDYETKLAGIAGLQPPPGDLRMRAAACAAVTLAAPPTESGSLRLPCDSGGAALLREIAPRLGGERPDMQRERRNIARFLAQDAVDSYAAYNLVRMHEAGRATAQPLSRAAGA